MPLLEHVPTATNLPPFSNRSIRRSTALSHVRMHRGAVTSARSQHRGSLTRGAAGAIETLFPASTRLRVRSRPRRAGWARSASHAATAHVGRRFDVLLRPASRCPDQLGVRSCKEGKDRRPRRSSMRCGETSSRSIETVPSACGGMRAEHTEFSAVRARVIQWLCTAAPAVASSTNGHHRLAVRGVGTTAELPTGVDNTEVDGRLPPVVAWTSQLSLRSIGREALSPLQATRTNRLVTCGRSAGEADPGPRPRFRAGLVLHPRPGE